MTAESLTPPTTTPAPVLAVAFTGSNAFAFDRLRQIREWLQIAKSLGFDWTKLGAIGEAVKDAIAAETLQAKAAGWIHVLDLVSQATETTVDDGIAKFLKQLQDSGLINLVVDVVGGWLGLSTPRAFAAAEAEAGAKAVDWNLLLQIAKFVYDLIVGFLNRGK